MLLRALLLVIGALNFVSGTALAVDRGQFENVPDDIRAWFKGVRSPAGVPCCDISDGHRTEYDVRSGAYWVPINGLWWQVPEKAIVRNAGNPLGEAVVWYVSLRGNIEIRCFVPADAARAVCRHLLPEDAACLIAGQLSPSCYLSKVIAFCQPRSPV